MKNFTCLGIALRPVTLERVNALADAKSLSRTVYIRQLIEADVANAERGLVPDIGRLLVLQEHQSLVLDALAREIIRDRADGLARDSVDAMKKHHGA